MTTATREKIIGDPVDRVDGPPKVTGAAPLPVGLHLSRSHTCRPGAVHDRGRHASGASTPAKAEAAPGVLAVITHENAPALVAGPTARFDPSPTSPR